MEVGLWMLFSLMALASTVDVSYNQPQFCTNVSWNANGTTFANVSLIGSAPYGLYVDVKNTVYAPAFYSGYVLVWYTGDVYPSRILIGVRLPLAIYATTNGDIYCDNGAGNMQVNKYTVSSNAPILAMNVSRQCGGLFTDINNTLYCSQFARHIIVTVSLNNIQIVPTIITGIPDTAGAQLNMMNNPYGIFVDIQFNLYVADSLNNRIMKFQAGQSTGTVLAGGSATRTVTLNEPRGVILDGNGYVYIADYGNHRIVASGPNGFQCILGCSGIGSAANQLNNPQIMAFDSYGNLFVTDKGNNRIQKFVPKDSFCFATTTSTAPTTTQVLTAMQNTTSPSTARNGTITASPAPTTTPVSTSTRTATQATVSSTVRNVQQSTAGSVTNSGTYSFPTNKHLAVIPISLAIGLYFLYC